MNAESMALAKAIEEADAVLIGASNGLSMAEGYNIFTDNEWFRQNFSDFRRRYGIRRVLVGIFCPYPSPEEQWGFISRLARLVRAEPEASQVMQDLRKIVGNKDVFVLTTNGDDHFPLAGFAPGNVFAMEGTIPEVTCSRHCTPEVVTDLNAVARMGAAEKDGRVPTEAIPRCEHCGSLMEPSGARNNAFFQTPHWRAQAQAFEDFAERNAEKRVVVLDIGIGPRNQMLRRPLQQFAFTAPNALYAALNMDPVSLPGPLGDKSIELRGDIARSLADLAAAVH